jgi:hypothetical protein
MLLVLGLVFLVAIAVFVMNGFSVGALLGSVSQPTATHTSTFTPTAIAPVGVVNPALNTATATQPPATAPIVVVPSPTPVLANTPLPTATALLLPSPTELPPPTETPAPAYTPTDTPTAVVSPSPTFVPTAPTLLADAGVVVACTTVPDERLALTDLDPAITQALGCAKEAATEAVAQSLSFQNGSMIYIEDQSDMYVYYTADQGWFRANIIMNGNEQGVSGGPPPPAPDLYIPQSVFGVVWRRKQLELGLGYATAPEPQHLSVVKQVFSGGTVIKNSNESKKALVFLKTKEQ